MTLREPLRFQPILKRYLWGGRRLGTHLGKRIGPESDYAESWEICDHGSDQSRVASGPLAGTTLSELVASHGPDLLGRHRPQAPFPLLLKFLDARQLLSVQVHPNDEQAARLDPPDLGKTEAWVVLAAEPDSTIYLGLKRGFDRHALERELARGTCELCLNRLKPRAGDCFFVPAGTVHALGGGLLVAEIQQASDATLRLFDWNRLGADGKPRPLHIEQALDVIDFDQPPPAAQTPQPSGHPEAQRLVACDKFVLDRWRLTAEATIGGDHRFHMLAVVSGGATLTAEATEEQLILGDTLLLPAACPAVRVCPRGSVEILDAYLP